MSNLIDQPFAQSLCVLAEEVAWISLDCITVIIEPMVERCDQGGTVQFALHQGICQSPALPVDRGLGAAIGVSDDTAEISEGRPG